MAHEHGGKDISFIAAEDLSSMKYRFVVQADDRTVRMMDAATEYPCGILQNDPKQGEVAVVRTDGTSKLVANAALAVNAPVKSEYVSTSDNGKADAADTLNDLVRARVIQAAGAEDDLCEVRLMDYMFHA